ncbi:hypothetical protein C8R46DRAFT_1196240, partial [Mycena filopes]
MVFFAGLVLVSSTLSVQLLLAAAQKAVCPDYDKTLQVLNTSAPQPDGDDVTSCLYYDPFKTEQNLCQYSSNGTFYNGSSTCPDSAAYLNLLCQSYDGLGSLDQPDGNPLDSSLNGSDPSGLMTWCFYQTSTYLEFGACPYSQNNGSFLPHTLFPQAVASQCPPTIDPTHLNSTGFNCSSTDVVGNSLIGASVNIAQQLA